jgi:hypothetical protein
MIPKVNIRQKKTETLFDFRQRLQEHLEASKIEVVEVPYNIDSVTDFQTACQQLSTVTYFPKNRTKLCDWCSYKQYCESNGEVDYMII